MPPKQSKKAKESEEFDAFLKELQQTTKVAGQDKAKKKHSEGLSMEQRQKKHHDQMDAINKAKAAEFERMLEQQQRQRQIQALLQQMMNQPRPFLSAPKTDVEKEIKANGLFQVATGSMQGWRAQMEDAHSSDLEFSPAEKAGLFAVFDGHAGDKCSSIARFALPALAKKHYKPTTDAEELKTFFTTIFAELDHSLKGKLPDSSGSTAVLVLVTDKVVACASVGDSRALLCRGGKCVALTEDHKPDTPHEKARIIAAGGHVENNRVNGQLAMSRAIGDFQYKENAELSHDSQLVIAVPDITVHPRQKDDQYIILGCDGVFDVLSNEECVAMVVEEMSAVKNPVDNAAMGNVVENICHHCVAPSEKDQPARPEGTDNVTLTIVKLL